MVNLTALDGLEKFFDIKLDRKRVRFPKMHPMFKGSTHVSVIRRPMTENEKMAYQKSSKTNQENKSSIAEAGSKTSTPTTLQQVNKEKNDKLANLARKNATFSNFFLL